MEHRTRTIGSNEEAGSLASIRCAGTRVDVGRARGPFEQPRVEPVAPHHEAMSRWKIGVDRHAGGLEPEPVHPRRVGHTDELL